MSADLGTSAPVRVDADTDASTGRSAPAAERTTSDLGDRTCVDTSRSTGSLDLTFERRGDRTVLTRQHHRGALRIMRPHYLDDSGQPCVTVVNPGGGYLDGDRYAIDLRIGEGAAVMVRSQAATKVYRTPTDEVRQRQRFGVEGTLELVPDPLIAYADATYVQTTVADVAPVARFVATDVVTPGWAADGSGFPYRSVRLRTEVRTPGASWPDVLDNVLLEPGRQDVAGRGFLDGYTHLGSLLAIAPEVDADVVQAVHALTEEMEGVRCGVSGLGRPGLSLRVLGRRTHDVQSVLDEVHTLLRRSWGDPRRPDLRRW